jgi:hypothetical protein
MLHMTATYYTAFLGLVSLQQLIDIRFSERAFFICASAERLSK